MHKAVKITIGVVLAVAAAAGGGYYYWQSTRTAPLSETYRLHTVTRGEISESVTAEGTVEPENTVTLYLDAAQTVSVVRMKDGDAVKAGDILVEYDIADTRRELTRLYQEAEINLANAKLVLESIITPAAGNELLQYKSEVTTAEKNVFDAENDLQSVESKIAQQKLRVDDAQRVRDENAKLLESGLLSQSAYDTSETAYRTAAEAYNDLLLQKTARENTLAARGTQLSDAKTRLANAQNKLSETGTTLRHAQQENAVKLAELALEEIEDEIAKLTETTKSTVTGGVLSVSAVEGATLPKGGVVAKLADLSAIIVRADVTEYDAPMLAVGQQVIIRSGALPGAAYTGVVSKIAVSAVKKEKSSGSEVVVPVEITVQNADEMLKTGYSVDAEVFLSRKDNVLSVPTQALRYDNDSAYVYLLQNETAVKTPVTLGLRGDRAAEVLSGLSENDVVLLDY